MIRHHLSFAAAAWACVSAIANTTVQVPPQNAGTGSHDFYNLMAEVGTDPATYEVCVASYKKVHLDDVTIVTETGASLPIISKDIAKAGMGIFKSEVIVAKFTREQLEMATKNGMTLQLLSKRGGIKVSIPASQFVALRDVADPMDTHRMIEADRRQFEERRLTAMKIYSGLETEIESLREELSAFKQTGTGKVSGQAFLKTRGGDVKVGAGNTIWLVPNTTWARTILAMEDALSGATKPPRLEEAFMGVVRTTEADASGNFEFTDLPAGKFVLTTKIAWTIPGRYGPEETGGRVTREVTISNGATKIMLTR